MPTLSDTLAIERDRCSLLVQDFNRIGSAGAFGAALVREAVGHADAAMRSREAATMQRALAELQRWGDLRPAAASLAGAAPAPVRAIVPTRLCAPAQRFLQAA